MVNMEEKTSSMVGVQESPKSSIQVNFKPASKERRSSGVSASVNKSNSSAPGAESSFSTFNAKKSKGGPCKTKEQKMHNTFPWIPELSSLFQASTGCRNVKSLENLMTLYLENVTPCVKDCYSKVIRASMLKKNMKDVLVFFHLTYKEVKEAMERSVYLDLMTPLVSMFMDMEIKASIRGKESFQKLASRLTSSLYLFLDNSEEHVLDAILMTKYVNKRYREICYPLLQKLLSNISNRKEDMFYVRYLLTFKLCKKMVPDPRIRKQINNAAVRKLHVHPNLLENVKAVGNIFPRIPKTTKNITLFLMQSNFCLKDACQEFLKSVKKIQKPVFNQSFGNVDMDLPMCFMTDSGSDVHLLSENDEEFLKYLKKTQTTVYNQSLGYVNIDEPLFFTTDSGSDVRLLSEKVEIVSSNNSTDLWSSISIDGIDSPSDMVKEWSIGKTLSEVEMTTGSLKKIKLAKRGKKGKKKLKMNSETKMQKKNKNKEGKFILKKRTKKGIKLKTKKKKKKKMLKIDESSIVKQCIPQWWESSQIKEKQISSQIEEVNHLAAKYSSVILKEDPFQVNEQSPVILSEQATQGNVKVELAQPEESEFPKAIQVLQTSEECKEYVVEKIKQEPTTSDHQGENEINISKGKISLEVTPETKEDKSEISVEDSRRSELEDEPKGIIKKEVEIPVDNPETENMETFPLSDKHILESSYQQFLESKVETLIKIEKEDVVSAVSVASQCDINRRKGSESKKQVPAHQMSSICMEKKVNENATSKPNKLTKESVMPVDELATKTDINDKTDCSFDDTMANSCMIEKTKDISSESKNQLDILKKDKLEIPHSPPKYKLSSKQMSSSILGISISNKVDEPLIKKERVDVVSNMFTSSVNLQLHRENAKSIKARENSKSDLFGDKVKDMIKEEVVIPDEEDPVIEKLESSPSSAKQILEASQEIEENDVEKTEQEPIKSDQLAEYQIKMEKGMAGLPYIDETEKDKSGTSFENSKPDLCDDKPKDIINKEVVNLVDHSVTENEETSPSSVEQTLDVSPQQLLKSKVDEILVKKGMADVTSSFCLASQSDLHEKGISDIMEKVPLHHVSPNSSVRDVIENVKCKSNKFTEDSIQPVDDSAAKSYCMDSTDSPFDDQMVNQIVVENTKDKHSEGKSHFDLPKRKRKSPSITEKLEIPLPPSTPMSSSNVGNSIINKFDEPLVKKKKVEAVSNIFVGSVDSELDKKNAMSTETIEHVIAKQVSHITLENNESLECAKTFIATGEPVHISDGSVSKHSSNDQADILIDNQRPNVTIVEKSQDVLDEEVKNSEVPISTMVVKREANCFEKSNVAENAGPVCMYFVDMALCKPSPKELHDLPDTSVYSTVTSLSKIMSKADPNIVNIPSILNPSMMILTHVDYIKNFFVRVLTDPKLEERRGINHEICSTTSSPSPVYLSNQPKLSDNSSSYPTSLVKVINPTSTFHGNVAEKDLNIVSDSVLNKTELGTGKINPSSSAAKCSASSYRQMNNDSEDEIMREHQEIRKRTNSPLEEDIVLGDEGDLFSEQEVIENIFKHPNSEVVNEVLSPSYNLSQNVDIIHLEPQPEPELVLNQNMVTLTGFQADKCNSKTTSEYDVYMYNTFDIDRMEENNGIQNDEVQYDCPTQKLVTTEKEEEVDDSPKSLESSTPKRKKNRLIFDGFLSQFFYDPSSSQELPTNSSECGTSGSSNPHQECDMVSGAGVVQDSVTNCNKQMKSVDLSDSSNQISDERTLKSQNSLTRDKSPKTVSCSKESFISQNNDIYKLGDSHLNYAPLVKQNIPVNTENKYTNIESYRLEATSSASVSFSESDAVSVEVSPSKRIELSPKLHHDEIVSSQVVSSEQVRVEEVQEEVKSLNIPAIASSSSIPGEAITHKTNKAKLSPKLHHDERKGSQVLSSEKVRVEEVQEEVKSLNIPAIASSSCIPDEAITYETNKTKLCTKLHHDERVGPHVVSSENVRVEQVQEEVKSVNLPTIASSSSIPGEAITHETYKTKLSPKWHHDERMGSQVVSNEQVRVEEVQAGVKSLNLPTNVSSSSTPGKATTRKRKRKKWSPKLPNDERVGLQVVSSEQVRVKEVPAEVQCINFPKIASPSSYPGKAITHETQQKSVGSNESCNFSITPVSCSSMPSIQSTITSSNYTNAPSYSTPSTSGGVLLTEGCSQLKSALDFFVCSSTLPHCPNSKSNIYPFIPKPSDYSAPSDCQIPNESFSKREVQNMKSMCDGFIENTEIEWKSPNAELLKHVEENLKITKYDLNSETSLPLKKRLKKATISYESAANIIVSKPKTNLDSFPSYSTIPMMSLVDLVNENYILSTWRGGLSNFEGNRGIYHEICSTMRSPIPLYSSNQPNQLGYSPLYPTNLVNHMHSNSHPPQGKYVEKIVNSVCDSALNNSQSRSGKINPSTSAATYNCSSPQNENTDSEDDFMEEHREKIKSAMSILEENIVQDDKRDLLAGQQVIGCALKDQNSEVANEMLGTSYGSSQNVNKVYFLPQPGPVHVPSQNMATLSGPQNDKFNSKTICKFPYMCNSLDVDRVEDNNSLQHDVGQYYWPTHELGSTVKEEEVDDLPNTFESTPKRGKKRANFANDMTRFFYDPSSSQELSINYSKSGTSGSSRHCHESVMDSGARVMLDSMKDSNKQVKLVDLSDSSDQISDERTLNFQNSLTRDKSSKTVSCSKESFISQNNDLYKLGDSHLSCAPLVKQNISVNTENKLSSIEMNRVEASSSASVGFSESVAVSVEVSPTKRTKLSPKFNHDERVGSKVVSSKLVRVEDAQAGAQSLNFPTIASPSSTLGEAITHKRKRKKLSPKLYHDERVGLQVVSSEQVRVDEAQGGVESLNFPIIASPSSTPGEAIAHETQQKSDGSNESCTVRCSSMPSTQSTTSSSIDTNIPSLSTPSTSSRISPTEGCSQLKSPLDFFDCSSTNPNCRNSKANVYPFIPKPSGYGTPSDCQIPNEKFSKRELLNMKSMCDEFIEKTEREWKSANGEILKYGEEKLKNTKCDMYSENYRDSPDKLIVFLLVC